MSLNLLIELAIQVATLGVVGGVLWTKVSYLEKELDETRQTINDLHEIRKELAIVKTQLDSIRVCLERLADFVHKREAAQP